MSDRSVDPLPHDRKLNHGATNRYQIKKKNNNKKKKKKKEEIYIYIIKMPIMQVFDFIGPVTLI